MRVKTRVNISPEYGVDVRDILNPFGLHPVVPPTYHISLYRDDERYTPLVKELEKRKIKFDEFPVNMVFSKAEMSSAEYLYMRMAGYWGYPKPEDDFLNESYDTSRVCPHCGQGPSQVRPLLVGKPGKFGNRDIAALNWVFAWLVTDRLRKLVQDENLTGAEFWPLLYFKDRTEVEGISQLKVTNILPPMSPNAEFEVIRENRPRKCSHLPRIFSSHQMRYLRKDLPSFKDFNLTDEYLGGGWFRLDRSTVVSSAVWRLFDRNKIKRVTFNPVILEM